MTQIEKLEELERTMCSFLDRVKDNTPEPDQMATFMARCRELGADMEDPTKLREGLDEQETDHLIEVLERLVKLNAILRETVATQRDSLGQAITDNRRNQRDLARQSAGELPGGSCDLAG